MKKEKKDTNVQPRIRSMPHWIHWGKQILQKIHQHISQWLFLKLQKVFLKYYVILRLFQIIKS